MRIEASPQLPGMSDADSKALWQAAKGMESNLCAN